MLTIKCLFPKNQYTLRKATIKTASDEVFYIGHTETITIPNPKGIIRFRLDYHSTKLNTSEIDNDAFVLVYLKHRKTFPYIYTDIMFKNAMEARVVSKSEFNNFESEYFSPADVSPAKISLAKIISYILVGIAYSGITAGSVVLLDEQHSDRNFLFIISIASLFSLFRLVFYRNSISERGYFWHMNGFCFVVMVLAFFSDLPTYISVSLLIVSVFTLCITAYESLVVRNASVLKP